MAIMVGCLLEWFVFAGLLWLFIFSFLIVPMLFSVYSLRFVILLRLIFLDCFVSLQSLLYSGLSMIVLWFVCCKLTVSLVWAIAHSSTGTSIVMLVSGST